MPSAPDQAFSSLRTDRLVIDRLAAADVPVIAAYRNDPSVAEFQSWPMPYTISLAEELVAATLGRDDSLVAGAQLAIRTAGSPSVLVGDVMVEPVAGATHDFELGITIAPEWQRLGYAREALGAVIEALFADPRVHRLIAYVDVANTLSLNLFDRLGFEREGLPHSSFERHGDGLVDEVRFGLTRSAWPRPSSSVTDG